MAANTKPVLNLCTDEPMHMVKPVSNVSAAGTKRKFESMIENCEEVSLSTKVKKKPLLDWSCTLCKVKTKCEYQLKVHLNGKKHKAKEKDLIRSQTNASTDRETVTLTQPQSTNAMIAEKTGNEFWCTLCNFGARSEAEMNGHKMGNSHLRLFMETGGFFTQIEPMLDDMII